MGVITAASFAKANWPGVNKFFGMAYNEWKEEYPALFSIETSSKAFEEDVGTSGFGLPAEKTEGRGIQYDDASQSFVMRYQHKSYALGYVITQEAIEDNQYGDIKWLGKKPQALASSMRRGMEVLAANVYNKAFLGITYNDGVALCSASQVTKAGGTYANMLSVAADLSEAALEQACIDIAGFTNDRGLKISVMPDKLIIPKELMFEAERILKSTLQNDSANNAINALKTVGAFPGGVHVNHYLLDADAWFVRTNCPDGMKMFKRINTEFGMDNDFDTYNAKFKARFRVSFGVTDKRGIFASAGA